MMPPYEPTGAVEVCAGGTCGKLGERFAVKDVARAIGAMFERNGPGVWKFCEADRHTRQCGGTISYLVNGPVPATGYVPQGALRAGARYDGESGVAFRVNIPTVVWDVAAVCDDARSSLSVRSPNNILWLSNPYFCSWGGGPKTIKAEGRYGIDFIDFDNAIMGGEFVIRVSEGGNGFTTGYAVTSLSTGMKEARATWLSPASPAKIKAQTKAFAPPKPRVKPLAIRYRKGPTRPDDIAVIIGNGGYSRRGMDIPDVDPAHADAASFRRYALDALGIRPGNIIDLRDATGAQMTRIFGSSDNHKGQLFDWTRRVSNVWVYYSGHGAPGGGGAYLVPTDADASRIELGGYSLGALYRNLGKLPARSVTVVLEACFSGLSQGGAVIAKSSGLYVTPKTPSAPGNLTVITAGAADQIASWEENGANSLFTKYFLHGMSGEADKSPYGNDDGAVAWEELDAYLKDTMTYYARRYYGRDQTAQIRVGRGR